MDSALKQLGKDDHRRMTRLIRIGDSNDLRRLSLRQCGIDKNWDYCSEEEKKKAEQLIADKTNKVLEQEKATSKEYSLEEFEIQLMLLFAD